MLYLWRRFRARAIRRRGGLKAGPAACAVLAVAASLSFAGVLPVVLSGCARDMAFGFAGEPSGGPQPRRLTFTIETEPACVEAARSFASQLEALGVRVKVEVLPRDLAAQRALAGESDACLLALPCSSPDPLGYLPSKLCPSGSENYSGYDNPEMGLLLAAPLSPRSVEEKEAAALAAREFLLEEAPWTPGLAQPVYDASVAELSGWHPGPAGRVSLHDAALTGGGDVITVGLGLSELPPLDPLSSDDPQAGAVIRCLFDALVAVGPAGNLVGELAESWEFSTNARRLTVRLREGVKFHNGDPLRADDVVFTYERALAGRLPQAGMVKVAVGPGETVVFDFSGPFPQFLDLFGLEPIVPARYYVRVGPEAFSRAPVGTGPFRLSPESQGRQLVLERWEDYYGGCPSLEPCGVATLREVIFVAIPDPERRRELLAEGSIHLAPALGPATAALIPATGVTVKKEPGWTILVVELNNRRPPFSDTRVRLALSLGLDPGTLASGMGPGAVVLTTGFFPGSLKDTAAGDPDRYDPAMAKELIEEAGYVVSGSG
ncbi:MAG: hypothetical protein C4551_10940 [Bacillota bacterium]|nr:MAG: hypothetical protein C4551_10940 [Bacillota bacterium]